MISGYQLGESSLDFTAVLELRGTSRDFPCHVNLQPAPDQCSLAEDTNSALFVLLDRLSEGGQHGGEELKKKVKRETCL